MNKTEKISTVALASLFSLRMLGLFMILPVFSRYAFHLPGATPTLVGVTLGIYGLTQASLQIPFGFLSDRLGRKPIIAIGLGCFMLGSIIAACSTSIYGILIGRALQGAAAIGSVILALLADLTRFEERGQAMAIVGVMIAVTFSIALILGPVINAWIGVAGIFWLSALLGTVGFVILYRLVPTPATRAIQADAQPVRSLFKSVLSNLELIRLDVGIFVLHAVLTALFVVLPILLAGPLQLSAQQEWKFYLPIILLAFLAALPFIRLTQNKPQVRFYLLINIVAIGVSIAGLLVLPIHLLSTGILTWLFFTAFTVLEATLPAIISKLASPGSRGTALGVYSTLQFLGIFAGGSIAGALLDANNFAPTFIFCLILSLVWFIVAAGMKNPLQNVRLH